MAAASVNLHALADDIRTIPHSGMIAAAKAAKAIAADEGDRAGGPLKGKKKRGLKLRARDDIRDTATGTTCRIQGVSPAGWVWVTSGTAGHPVRRRKRKPKGKTLRGKPRYDLRKMTVDHPGTAGHGAWHKVVKRVTDAVPLIFADTVREVVD